ncbi:MAG: carboxypeptidase regulatory-like domain-containing protein [Vicinamibacterales bacterium]
MLRDLNAGGLRIVFSTTLVTPGLRVISEPAGPTPRDVLDQVLAPHGLEARPGPRDILVVARASRRRRAAAPAVAPPALGAVRGHVVDADTDAPLADVLVVAQASDQRTTTAADGSFVLDGVSPGRLPLFVSLVGYVLARPEVEVAAGATTEIVVPLTAGAGAYTEQLTVRGGIDAVRSATPAEFTVRSAELQELRGVLADDPLRALQSLPGVATGDDFRAEFSVRGSEMRQMGFTLDGVPAPWLVHGARAVEDTGTVAMVNADVIDEVTLQAGATAQTVGNRSAAWVHTRLRDGSRDALRMTGSLSATGASAVVEGPLGGARRGSWLATVRQSYIDWLIRRLDTQEATTFGFTDGQATAVFDVTPRHQLRLSAVAGRSSFDEADETPSINGVRVGKAASALVVGAWRATLGNALVLTQRTAWTGVRYDNTSDFDLELARGREWTWTYRAEATAAPRQWLALDAGASLDRDWATFRRQLYSGVPDAAPVLRNWFAWERSRWRQGGFARLRLTPRPSLQVDGGARLDRESVHGEVTGSPWLTARWTVAPRWTLGAGAGVAHQVPDLAQLSPDGTADPIGAERARFLDGSVSYAVGADIEAQLSIYDRAETGALRLDEVLPRLVDGIPAAPFASGLWTNGIDVDSHGIELSLRRRASAGLVGWIAYAYGNTRNTDRRTGERYWGDFDQRHTLNVHASYRIGTRTNASAKLRVGSNMPVLGYFAPAGEGLVLAPTRNDTRLPTYARLDLRLNRTYNYARRRLTLFAEVLNVLARENLGRTDGGVRSNGQVNGYVETLFPLLPSVGLRVEF